ncbi:MAG: hypothetical protein ACW99A_18175 [Candidatus Kariarchaeaceae archaeon]|jgi:hypothetical protein
MLEELNALIGFSMGIIKVWLILMIAPFFLWAFINVIYSIIGLVLALEKKPRRKEIEVTRSTPNSHLLRPDYRYSNTYSVNSYKQSKRTSEVGRLVSFITFPGTLFRVALMFLLLRLKGWELSISYPGLVGTLNRSLSDQRRSGFFISMKPNSKRRITLKDTVHMSLVGYIPMILAYFMWISRHDQIDFMIYLQQGNVNIIWIYFIYYYLLFAILIGGAPIPEETMVPIYYLLGRYPHVIFGIISAYCLSFLISLMEFDGFVYEADRIARLYFLVALLLIISHVLINEEHLKITRKELDQRALELSVVDLI